MPDTKAAPKLLEFERAVTATLLADVQLSPDGEQVAYVTTPASREDLTSVMSIWLVDDAGGTPRRLTTSDGLDAQPRWSPDGKRIAFISDRKERGKPQLYVLDLAGGEAIRLTEQPGGEGAPQWSPDGTKLAMLVKDPETDEEKKRKEERDDAKVADASWKRNALYILDVPADAATLTALPEARRLSPEGLNIGADSGVGLSSSYSWAPDSLGLVAIATPTPKADDGFHPDVVTFDLSGEMQTLGNYEGLWSRPIYRPDGSTIGFIACEDGAPAYFALSTIPATGGPAQAVLPGYAGSFHHFAWLPEGDRMLALVEEGQSHRLRIVDPEDHSAKLACDPTGRPGNSGGFFGVAPSLSADGKRMAFVWGDATTHANVWVADVNGEAKQLTDLNPWIRDYTFGKVREISWSAPDGLEIQGLVILPVGYEEGTRYPALLHIHGGPMAAWTHRFFAGGHDWGQLWRSAATRCCCPTRAAHRAAAAPS
jgi:dipeptidyl aminopeptidase/acylaminoacyl peptidase